IRDRIDLPGMWKRLRSSGWLARLATSPDPYSLVARAVEVLAALPEPGTRCDRRTLVATDPHALDDGKPLPGLVFALTRATRLRPGAAWNSLGVDCDDLTGGLLALGIHPVGWSLPSATVVTVPPYELARCNWPPPSEPDRWVFVTENPSVVKAAA